MIAAGMFQFYLDLSMFIVSLCSVYLYIVIFWHYLRLTIKSLDCNILHTATTFLTSMPVHTGKGGILFPHPKRNIIRKIIFTCAVMLKKKHVRRTVTETRSHFRSFLTTCRNIEESNTRLKVDVQYASKQTWIQNRMSSLNKNMSDPVAALTHQISCWTVLRHLVDKTNRILEEVLQARHVSNMRKTTRTNSKYWKTVREVMAIEHLTACYLQEPW